LGRAAASGLGMYKGMKMDGKKLYKVIIETPKIKGAGALGVFFMKI